MPAITKRSSARLAQDALGLSSGPEYSTGIAGVSGGVESASVRSTLAKDLQKIQGDQQAANPGAEVFSRAFDLLGRLKAKQEAKKNEGDEGEATEPSPKTEGQKP